MFSSKLCLLVLCSYPPFLYHYVVNVLDSSTDTLRIPSSSLNEHCHHPPLYCHQVHPLFCYHCSCTLVRSLPPSLCNAIVHPSIPPVLHPYSPPPHCCHPCVHLSPSALYCPPCSSLHCPLTLASFAGNAL
jgi:hypothetical protein